MIFELTLEYSTEVEEENPYLTWRVGESLAEWLSKHAIGPEDALGDAAVSTLSWLDDNGKPRGVTQRPRDPSLPPLPPKEQLPMAVGDKTESAENGAGKSSG